jgi:hypothetical protein
MASDQMIMRFPMYSTVTYIAPKGAPTIILNQTIIKNGNVEVPAVPEQGWFVYPKVNKVRAARRKRVDGGRCGGCRLLLFGHVSCLQDVCVCAASAPCVVVVVVVLAVVVVPPDPTKHSMAPPTHDPPTPPAPQMMVQRGDLNHGANDAIAAKPLLPGEHRITFVVSWEDVKPLEPNCHYIGDDEMPPQVKVPATRPPDWHLGASIQRVPTTKVVPRHGGSEARWFELPLGRDGSRLHALLPVPRNRQSVPDPSGSYLLEWGRREVFGQVYELDLHSNSQRRMLFSGGKPVVIMIVAGKKKKKKKKKGGGGGGDAAAQTRGAERMGALRAAKAWIGRYGVESANFFLGDADTHANVLGEFGLRKKDCPIAMVHHVHREGAPMYVMNRRTNRHAEWTSRRILRFLSKVQKGKVKKIGSKGLRSRRFEEL